MAVICYTYTQVIKVLWKTDNSISRDNENDRVQLQDPVTDNTNINENINENGSTDQLNFSLECNISRAKTRAFQRVNARRKTAKMLISVAVIFALCYLPIYLLNISR